MKLTEWIDKKTEEIMGKVHEIKDWETKPTFMQPTLCNMLSEGNDIKTMRDRSFHDPEEVMHCLHCYQNVIAAFNELTIFIPSIETFCMFMGWTSKVYRQMLTDTSADIMEVTALIEDYIVENQLAAGQTGAAGQTITKFRTQAAGEHGHGIVTQKEQNDEDHRKKDLLSKDDLEQQLIKMGFKTPKARIEERMAKKSDTRRSRKN